MKTSLHLFVALVGAAAAPSLGCSSETMRDSRSDCSAARCDQGSTDASIRFNEAIDTCHDQYAEAHSTESDPSARVASAQALEACLDVAAQAAMPLIEAKLMEHDSPNRDQFASRMEAYFDASRAFCGDLLDASITPNGPEGDAVYANCTANRALTAAMMIGAYADLGEENRLMPSDPDEHGACYTIFEHEANASTDSTELNRALLNMVNCIQVRAREGIAVVAAGQRQNLEDQGQLPPSQAEREIFVETTFLDWEVAATSLCLTLSEAGKSLGDAGYNQRECAGHAYEDMWAAWNVDVIPRREPAP